MNTKKKIIHDPDFAKVEAAFNERGQGQGKSPEKPVLRLLFTKMEK